MDLETEWNKHKRAVHIGKTFLIIGSVVLGGTLLIWIFGRIYLIPVFFITGLVMILIGGVIFRVIEIFQSEENEKRVASNFNPYYDDIPDWGELEDKVFQELKIGRYYTGKGKDENNEKIFQGDYAFVEKCIVCDLPISESEPVIRCPLCNQLAHYAHLLEWVKIKGYCPRCREKLRRNMLLPIHCSA